MLVTLANPLPLAIVGNPPKARAMAKRRASSRKLANRRQLRYRWRKRTRPGGRFAGYKARVLAKPGRRKKHAKPRGHRWAWTGRKGTVQLLRKGILVATNPIGSLKPLLVTPVTSLPKSLPALFKGKVVTNVALAGGGAITGLVGGNLLQGAVMGLASKAAPELIAKVMSKGLVQRVVGASFALLTGGVVARFALKSPQARAAFVTGTAAAALIEAVFPGRVASLLARLPVVGGLVAPQASPVNGLAGLFGSDELAGYVDAPSYQGVGAYVDARGYQGVGGYVDAPSYQGVGGMDDAVAGLGYDPNGLAGSGHLGEIGAMGSNMASHLDS